MLFKVDAATLLAYSPKGTSDISFKSRTIGGKIKNGDSKILDAAIVHINKASKHLSPFLNTDRILVPAPRSSPLVEGALWPTKSIADKLLTNKLGYDVLPLVQRVKSVPKSSFQKGADSRPSVEMHLDSLRVVPSILPTQEITIIDDILTLGRTTFACWLKLKDAYPDANIKVFTIMRTRGFIPDIPNIVDPMCFKMQYNTKTGKVWIPD